MEEVNKILKNFKVLYKTPVTWGEMDSFHHVNNIIYFRYFESARIRYFYESGIMDCMEKEGIGPILKETSCRYRFPLTYPDQLTIGARVSHLESDRFTHEYCIVSHGSKKIAAEGNGIIVAFDYQNNQKTNFPDEVLKKIETIEGYSLREKP